MVEPIPDRLERTLRQTMASGERVFVQLRGAFTEALVCTYKRVIILKDGWMTRAAFRHGHIGITLHICSHLYVKRGKHGRSAERLGLFYRLEPGSPPCTKLT